MTIIKKHILFFQLLNLVCFNILAQQDHSENIKKSFSIKALGLYDSIEFNTSSIYGFTQLNVFDGNLSNDVWLSKDSSCIKGKFEVDSSKSNYLILNWNKDQTNCNWVGLGFGWDGWSSKDMSYLRDSLTFAITLRSSKKVISNLPWAFGIEDYNGNQAWIGFKKEFLTKKTIDEKWSTLLIPLKSFPIIENDVDLSATKQLIIQLFAAGEVDLKSVQIVLFDSKKR